VSRRRGGRSARRRAGSGAGEGAAREDARRPASRERAWEYLLNLLTRQDYTVAELRAKLARRGVEEGLAEELLARLVELRLVDDASYAERYVSNRRLSHGRLALRRELVRRGVDEQVAAPHLGALDPDQQAAAATALLRKLAWRYRPAEPDEGEGEEDEHARFVRLKRAEARARAFLARRGFDPEATQSAIEAVGWFET
jgi:regulatory protein